MTRAGEIGSIRKPWGTAIPVALVYPNVYQLGMGNLGFQFLYKYLNSYPQFLAERFFFPDFSSRMKFPGRIISEESGRPLADFPLIAFSIPFENDYHAVPEMLLASGIPPLAKDRGPSDPFVIAGGLSVSMNPEPLADFLDIVFIGELEDTIDLENGLFSALEKMFRHFGNRNRLNLLDLLRGVPGVYIPSAYQFSYSEDGSVKKIETKQGFPARVRAVKRRAKGSSIPISTLFSPEAEFGDTLLVETNRGCSRGCRFCAAGWIHFPVRYAKFKDFQHEIDKALESGRRVGLIGSDLAGHPELEKILAYIVERGGNFSLSSIRPEGLTPRIISLLAKTGQRTATLAPEVGSTRMQKMIGKEIPQEKFYELVEKLVAAGIPNLRFYFMIGLPNEQDEDAISIADFICECRKIFVYASKPKKMIGKIGVQVNSFVPKPWTPFQWTSMAPLETLEKRAKIIRQQLKGYSNLAVRIEPPKQALIQAFLSRGDRKISDAILMAAKQKGKWSSIFKKLNIDLNSYIYRERSPNEIFPWDVTDHGIGKDKLWKIYLKEVKQTTNVNWEQSDLS